MHNLHDLPIILCLEKCVSPKRAGLSAYQLNTFHLSWIIHGVPVPSKVRYIMGANVLLVPTDL